MTRFTYFVLAIFALVAFSLPAVAETRTKAEASDTTVLSGLAPIDQHALSGYAGGYSVTTTNTNITNTATASADSYANTIDGSVATGGISNINVIGNNGMTSTITNTGNMVSISQLTAINVTLH